MDKKNSLPLLIIIFLILPLGCGSKKNIDLKPSITSSNVFFKGQVKFDMDSTVMATGKLIRSLPTYWKNGRLIQPISTCTGTLISSKIVVTAAHCIGHQSTVNKGVDYKYDPSTIKFYKNYGVGPKLYSQVVKIYTPSAADDIAFLEINSALGDQVNSIMEIGHPTIKSYRLSSYFGENYNSFGYPSAYKNGQIGLWDKSCSIKKLHQNSGSLYTQFKHNCLQTAGSSGGPIFSIRDGKASIVAIMHTEPIDTITNKRYTDGVEYSGEKFNLAIPLMFKDLLEYKIPSYVNRSVKNITFHFCNKKKVAVKLEVVSDILASGSLSNVVLEKNMCQEFTVDHSSEKDTLDLEVSIDGMKLIYTIFKDMPPDVIYL